MRIRKFFGPAVLSLLVTIISLQGQEELYLVESGPRMHGPAVEKLQKFLVYNGFDIGTDGVDGWFGTDTDKALKDF